MYSLYRAWFGPGEGSADGFAGCRESLSPPDTVIRVGNEGEHQFVAHKGVLAAHSGYLKALLSGTTSLANSTADSELPSTSSVTSVSVSSIGGEAFAPLLNYMYTGRLEVTLDNVYSVLLATHLLHMPGALEQCRAALLRLRAHQAPMGIPGPEVSPRAGGCASGRILRPIPNRPMIAPPPLCWPQPPPLYPSSTATHLAQLQPTAMLPTPAAISLIPVSILREAQEPSERREGSQLDAGKSRSEGPPLRAMRSISLPFVAAFTALAASGNAVNASAEPTTSSKLIPLSPSMSPSSSPASHSPTSHGASGSSKTTTERRASKHPREKGEGEARKLGNGEQRRSRDFSETSGQAQWEKTGESSGGGESIERARLAKRKGLSGSCNEDSAAGGNSVVYDVACCDGPVRFHRVLNENYSSTNARGESSPRSCLEGPENEENGGQGRAEFDERAGGSADSVSYTCGYCRHTFKSQYCYRKHTKRHLLPTATSPEDEAERRQRRENNCRSPREVRLLDLNVQYYPCKICGCKFPSYYFVHKHRKLCHSNVPDNPRGNPEESEHPQERDQPSRTSFENTNDTTVNVEDHATSMDLNSN